MKGKTLFFFIFLLATIETSAQKVVLVGYWQNWDNQEANYIHLDQIDLRYEIIQIAFAVPTSTIDMTMNFIPSGISQSVLVEKIKTLQNQGKKVLLSIGGATATIDLTTTANKDAFVKSLTILLNTYNFDGIDLDIENGKSVLLSGGTIVNPGSGNVAMTNLILAVKEIMVNYRNNFAKKLFLTITPQTANVQGGKARFGDVWGSYLPIIEALRDSMDLLQVQLYNSGSMIGLDDSLYKQGTVDFIISMTEMVIRGFTTRGGQFVGLPTEKITVCLPAYRSNGGFTDTLLVKKAINYLIGKGPKPGDYTLRQSSGYPTLGGMTTWSINWDKVNNYQYAENFKRIFETCTSIPILDEIVTWKFYPNPANDYLMVQGQDKFSLVEIYTLSGSYVTSIFVNKEVKRIDISKFPSGVYILRYPKGQSMIIKLGKAKLVSD